MKKKMWISLLEIAVKVLHCEANSIVRFATSSPKLHSKYIEGSFALEPHINYQEILFQMQCNPSVSS